MRRMQRPFVTIDRNLRPHPGSVLFLKSLEIEVCERTCRFDVSLGEPDLENPVDLSRCDVVTHRWTFVPSRWCPRALPCMVPIGAPLNSVERRLW